MRHRETQSLHTHTHTPSKQISIMGNGHSNSGTNKSTNQHVDTSQSQQHEEPKKRTPLQDLPTSSTRNNANQHSNIVGDAIPSKKEQQQKKEKKNFLFFPQTPQQKDEEDRSTLRTEQDPLLPSTSIPTPTTTQQVAALTNPLIDNTQATAVAVASAQIINESASQIKKATSATGFLTFRTLGLMGGIAMILSNFAGVIDRFMSFQFASGLSAFYGIFFGILSKLRLFRLNSIYFLGDHLKLDILIHFNYSSIQYNLSCVIRNAQSILWVFGWTNECYNTMVL